MQGVGFRPFIYRLANSRGLSGWVMNTPSGVVVEVQGGREDLEDFALSIPGEAPPLAVIATVRVRQRRPVREGAFVIRESGGAGDEVQVAPDSDVCPDCLSELFDPGDRRYRYPFINCTNCGPRFTIISGVPYDRELTTMRSFPMCDDCREEYHDPQNRRFHAQPNACPVCGPTLALLDGAGRSAGCGPPLDAAVRLLRDGAMIAVKGIGGYHLAVDATNEDAVRELRKRKKRDEKPFALMSPDLDAIAEYAAMGESEKKLLGGPERPIVLLRKKDHHPIAPLVAPSSAHFGVMLPYTPLHHLLLRGNFLSLVMTSGNLSDEPVCCLDREALRRLSGIADFFLTHNRDIHTRADDSVIRVFGGSPVFLRRSRGYAPRAIALPEINRNVLAVGAEQKNVFCLTRRSKAFLSQHIGDLGNTATCRFLEETVTHFRQVLKIQPEVVAHDLHPDYLSTGYALTLDGLPRVAVQHHHAHMASCMAENALEGDAIGVIFDGTGYGPDGTVWGGEFLAGGYAGFERKGHLLPVRLPGGDAAAREPYRMALSYLHSVAGESLFALPHPCVSGLSAAERALFQKMLERGINSPLTSSCGRLFDAVAALLGVRSRVSYEGQAAMELEALAESASGGAVYPYQILAVDGKWLQDFRPMIRALVGELASGRSVAGIARSFHQTLASAVVETCRLIREETGLDRVALSGGVFQNRLLSESVCALLSQADFLVFTQRLAPPNDGGIALGQAVIAGRSALSP